jgi:HEAT repeat protein
MPLIRGVPIGPQPADARDAAAILRTGTADERWSAARALGAKANKTTENNATDGTKMLAEALKSETDPRVREAILTSLVRIGSQESVDAVIPCLRADDAAIRGGALDALRAMIDVARPVLPGLLADPDADIRLLTCDLTRELPAPEATRLMCDVLARETQANVCAAAVDVLADIGEVEALPFLRACAVRFDDVTFLAFAVKVAMERIIAERPARHG